MLDALKRIFGPQGAATGDSELSAYREVLRRNPDHPEACANLGLLLADLGQLDEAEALLRRAAKLAPLDLDIGANLRIFLSRRAPVWQFPMMNDAARNAAYGRAIAKAVRPGDNVLEIGTGSGLLAMMAARCGARRVTTCEMLEPVAEKAREIVRHNGFGEIISVVAEPSTSLTVREDLGVPADVLISEIVANDLIGEGMLGSFEDAAARLLAPRARIVPSHDWIRGQLAGSQEIERYLRVGNAAGFDLSPFNEFAPVSLFADDLGVALDAYSEPFDLFDFDFSGQRSFPSERKRVSTTVTRDGQCHGVLQWIRLRLFEEIEVENSPGVAHEVGKGHWKRMLHVFAQPLDVKPGQTLSLVAAHNRKNLVLYPEV